MSGYVRICWFKIAIVSLSPFAAFVGTKRRTTSTPRKK